MQQQMPTSKEMILKSALHMKKIQKRSLTISSFFLGQNQQNI